ncbi:MAG: PLP-dependent transferase, partial [Gemmatimonadota bacterium]
MSGERDRERREASRPAGPGFATSVLHGGSGPGVDPRSRGDGGPRPHTPALHQSSAFTFPDAASAREAFRAESSSDADGEPAWIYSRLGNPTVRALERRLAALESHPVPRSAGGDGSPSPEGPDPDDVDACFFASGMGAISALLLSHAADGGRIVCQRGIYGTTEHLMDRIESWGARVTGVPVGDDEALVEAVASGPVDLVYVESPANPLLQVTDLAAAAEAAHRAGAALAVDATFAT